MVFQMVTLTSIITIRINRVISIHFEKIRTNIHTIFNPFCKISNIHTDFSVLKPFK